MKSLPQIVTLTGLSGWPPLADGWTALHAVNEMAFQMPFEGSVSTNSV